ncbi:MAG: SDR family NAD(P)-dependent oxidoreductase [Pseudomonadota bacterium]
MARPVALVTGASIGIGKEIAARLAREGHDLILVARSADKLLAVAEELQKKHGATSTVIAADLGQPGSAQKLFDAVQAKHLVVDVLVNNAGFGLKGRFVKLSLAEQQEMIQLNITTLTELCWLFGRDMAARGRGRILNVGSVGSFQPGPEFGVYSATKAYVLSFSEAIDAELRSQGVNVTALCPGAVLTNFHARASNESKILLATAMQAEPVARAGVRALFGKRPVVIPGLLNRIAIFSVRLMPRRVVTGVSYLLIGRSPT